MKKKFDARYFHWKLEKLLGDASKIAGTNCVDESDPSTWIVDFNQNATQTDIDAVTAYVAGLTSQDDVFVPEDVSKYQFKRALLAQNQLNNVLAQVPNLSNEAKLYWEDNWQIGRESILMTELQSLMGLTDAQIDNFFVNANNIEEK